MDRLSSCYFCGGALDVSLSEYPVVPTELRAEGEDSKRIVLCTTCRQKLATVVEEVVAATEADDATVAEATDDGFESGDTSADETGFDFADSDDESATATDTSVENTDDEDDSGGLLDGGSTDRTTTATDESGTDEPTTSAESSSESDESDDGPSLTKLEYNKVMRLLQNRELPVDRAEIRDVAINAYQISPEEFETVIDAAVERDLIAERDGKFVSPK